MFALPSGSVATSPGTPMPRIFTDDTGAPDGSMTFIDSTAERSEAEAEVNCDRSKQAADKPRTLFSRICATRAPSARPLRCVAVGRGRAAGGLLRAATWAAPDLAALSERVCGRARRAGWQATALCLRCDGGAGFRRRLLWRDRVRRG